MTTTKADGWWVELEDGDERWWGLLVWVPPGRTDPGYWMTVTDDDNVSEWSQTQLAEHAQTWEDEIVADSDDDSPEARLAISGYRALASIAANQEATRILAVRSAQDGTFPCCGAPIMAGAGGAHRCTNLAGGGGGRGGWQGPT